MRYNAQRQHRLCTDEKGQLSCMACHAVPCSIVADMTEQGPAHTVSKPNMTLKKHSTMTSHIWPAAAEHQPLLCHSHQAVARSCMTTYWNLAKPGEYLPASHVFA